MSRAYFNDERDLCFRCERNPDICGERNVTCTYTEATADDVKKRFKTEPIQHTEGIKERVLY